MQLLEIFRGDSKIVMFTFSINHWKRSGSDVLLTKNRCYP